MGRAGGRAGEGQARCGAHIMSAVFELAVARGRSVSGGRGLAEARDEWMEPGKLADIFESHGAGSTGPSSHSVASRMLARGASHASSALAALPAGSGGPSAPGLAGESARLCTKLARSFGRKHGLA